MEKEYFISIFLDKRREKSNKKYPVKLRVFTPSPRKQKLYAIKFEFAEPEFQSVWETPKPPNEHKQQKDQLRAIELFAEEIAVSIIPFSFTEFDKKLLRNKGDGTNVIFHYKQSIDKLRSNNSIGTASNYQLALKSLLGFITNIKYKTSERLLFSEITTERPYLLKMKN